MFSRGDNVLVRGKRNKIIDILGDIAKNLN
jgi:hypothetical protein